MQGGCDDGMERNKEMINEKRRKRKEKRPAPLDPTRRQRWPELREREKSWMRGEEPGGGWPSMPG